MEELTIEEQEAIACYEEANNEASKASIRCTDAYWAMIKTLGEKANCHLCGNAHWPICRDCE